MTDIKLPIRDAGLNVRDRRALDEGAAGITPYNAEHPEQRAALLLALAPLTQIVTLLTAEGGYLDGVETLLGAVRDKLLAAPATEAKQDADIAKLEAVRALLAGTIAVSAAALPLPVGAATSAKQDAASTLLTAMSTALAGTLAVRQTATAFTDRTVASLSLGQAAGTAFAVDQNANRRVFAITPTNDGRLYIATATGNGFYWPLYAGVTRVLSGADCPTNALYVTGQTAGTALPMAEG